MKRLASALATALLIAAIALSGEAVGRFDQKLSNDKQIVHLLNRMTFGARPGDSAEVSRMGVEAWIDRQLHPERIPENPMLTARVEPLESLQLAPWQITQKYVLPANMTARPNPNLANLIGQSQVTRLANGSLEERRTMLASFPPDLRRLVLSVIPAQALDGMPEDVRQEAARARQAEQEARQAEQRRMMPPLNELLTPEQQRALRGGSDAEKLAILNTFDPQRRQQVIRAAGPQAFLGMPELRRQAIAFTNPQQLVNFELIENKLYRAIHSNHQLEEVLVDFWLNHFNVYNGKGQVRTLLTSYERDAIRPYVFGHFRDMLLATARHPAMLIYLDNAQSQAPREEPRPPDPSEALRSFASVGVNIPDKDFADYLKELAKTLPGARALEPDRRPGLNENYGRELMELHTLGVNGGYTQDDVIAVARAFTGWTVFEPARYAEFTFNPNTHDRKEKVVLGHVLPAGRGEQDGLDVIDILVKHPSTAKFISKKLAQRFVSDDPPQLLIDKMAATFQRTDGDLRAVLQTLFSSTEFLSEGAWQAKLKSPLEFVVSATRALNADVVDTFVLGQRISDLGQPLYGKVEPTGYPNTGENWASAAGLLSRINIATALTSGQIPGVKVDISRFNFKPPATVANELLNMTAAPATIEAIEKGIQGHEATPSMLAASVLSSPDFQRR